METQEALNPRRTLLPGVIYFNHRKQSVNCIIRELSAQGATLVCTDTRVVPTNVFELYMPNRKEFYSVEVQERKADELHVAFIQEPSMANASSSEGWMREIVRRLDLLETEQKKLRQMANELRNKGRSDDCFGT